MAYVDGMVVPVPAGNKQAFSDMAKQAAAVFVDHGAVSVTDCWGDDVKDGKLTSLPMAVKLEPGEVVVFSWIRWPSKEVRDAGFAKAMADPRLAMDPAKFPFDGRRMIFGGFEVLTETINDKEQVK
jgi:uncharacterized protein YbaA (DUF1428 family)